MLGGGRPKALAPAPARPGAGPGHRGPRAIRKETVKVAIANDHAGYPLKVAVVAHLRQSWATRWTTSAPTAKSPSTTRPTVPPVPATSSAGRADLGIVIGGSGQGEQIAANKVHGARAALCHDEYTARLARQHNNANVLSLGARILAPELAFDIVDVFLSDRLRRRTSPGPSGRAGRASRPREPGVGGSGRDGQRAQASSRPLPREPVPGRLDRAGQLVGLELVRVSVPLRRAWVSEAGTFSARDSLLVRAVLASQARWRPATSEGWGECAALPWPHLHVRVHRRGRRGLPNGTWCRPASRPAWPRPCAWRRPWPGTRATRWPRRPSKRHSWTPSCGPPGSPWPVSSAASSDGRRAGRRRVPAGVAVGSSEPPGRGAGRGGAASWPRATAGSSSRSCPARSRAW